MIGGCALNHSLEKVHVRGKHPCTKVWDICAQWLCMVHDRGGDSLYGGNYCTKCVVYSL